MSDENKCSNCEALSKSNSTKPAVPMNGTCNDILHECPLDGQKWWQMNTHFHLWQKVKDDKQWEALREDLRRPVQSGHFW